jgi:hypothetical protein
MLSAGKIATSGTQAQTLRQISEQLASDLGVKDVSIAQSAIQFSLGVGAGSVSQKLAEALPMKLAAAGIQSATNQIDAAVKKATASLESAGILNVDQVVDSYMKSEEFRRLQSTNRESAQRIESNFQRATSYRESAGTDLRTAVEQRELAQKAETLSRNLNYNNVVEWNRYLRDQGLEGETDRNLLAATVPAFLRSGTFVADRNGEMWFKPYHGQGPSTIASPPTTDRERPSPESTQIRLNRGPGAVIQDRAANDSRARGRSSTSATTGPSEDALRTETNAGVSSVERKLDIHARKATSGRNQLGRDLDEARESVSVTHGLGNQPDGRSARQQLDKKPAEKTGGSSGEW